MSAKRYTDEFKIEAVRQIVEYGRPVAEVAERNAELFPQNKGPLARAPEVKRRESITGAARIHLQHPCPLTKAAEDKQTRAQAHRKRNF